MGNIVIMGEFDLHPEDTATAAELMREMANATVKEQGCQHYSYSRDVSTADRFQLRELWENEAALTAHFGMEHMATYRAGMKKLRVLKRTVVRYEVVNAAAL
jgi:quinol monooxygenase YgiN